MGFFGKLLGLFVERVPVDEQGRPKGRPVPTPKNATPAVPATNAPQPGPPQQLAQPSGIPHPNAPQHQLPPAAPRAAPPTAAAPTIAVALRAIVPQEYAAHLAPYGLHVLAAGGDVTSEQARGWGAQALVISAECLGRDLHLLQTPQLPTVFIAPQPVMIPEQPGVVQVHEPLHASDVARAVREAAQAWTAAGRTAAD